MQSRWLINGYNFQFHNSVSFLRMDWLMFITPSESWFIKNLSLKMCKQRASTLLVVIHTVYHGSALALTCSNANQCGNSKLFRTTGRTFVTQLKPKIDKNVTYSGYKSFYQIWWRMHHPVLLYKCEIIVFLTVTFTFLGFSWFLDRT